MLLLCKNPSLGWHILPVLSNMASYSSKVPSIHSAISSLETECTCYRFIPGHQHYKGLSISPQTVYRSKIEFLGLKVLPERSLTNILYILNPNRLTNFSPSCFVACCGVFNLFKDYSLISCCH